MKRWLAAGLVLAVLAAGAGCSTLGYYYQAARGHLAIVHAARPVDAWLRDPATTPDLRERLAAARDIREFASRALALPDNGSFRRYAELGRPFAVWNVVAAPEFSTRAREWCFPIAGCVAYKGWYDEAEAQRQAASLRAEGLDAFSYGVPAYSTLGWFDDPLLSTFLRYPRAEVARLVFHELAHQLVYVPGDSTFNESFATAVEEAGVRRWMEAAGTPAERAAFETMSERRKQFADLVRSTRTELDALYAQPLADTEKRPAKAAAFARMRERYAALKQSWGGFAGYDRWFAQPLSNAHMASIATYEDALPAFERLLAGAEGDLPRFYAAARTLAALPAEARARAMGVEPPR